MKAIILAGGEGTRLRPLTCGRPKPMVRLFDRPVMEYLYDLLTRNGFDELCATLGYLPESIEAQFAGRIRCVTEQTPLGTAGSVKNCAAFIGGEDFLVISGDAVCDFALREIWDFHRAHGGVATLVTCRHPEPLAYGLVEADAEGRLLRLCEKPDWSGVFTDRVNTGIYVFQARVLERIPAGQRCDFAAEVFPALLAAGEDVRVCEAQGSWWDIGDCGELLNCGKQALRGRLQLEIPAPLLRPGVWSASPLPNGVTVIPPCYIGAQVLLGEGAVIGPEALVCSGSVVEHGARVDGSLVMGARIGEHAVLRDAIVLESAEVQRDAALLPGSVAGHGARIRSAATVSEGVRLWPQTEVPAGAPQRRNLTGGRSETALLDGRGRISGDPATELTPEVLLALGETLAPLGTAALSCDGSAPARLALDSLRCGLRAAGGQGVDCDAAFLSQAAFAARRYGFPLSVFVEKRGGTLLLSLMGERGAPLTPAQRSRLRSGIRRGPSAPAGVGSLSAVSGIPRLHMVEAKQWALPEGTALPVCVVGDSRAADFCRQVLTVCGAEVGQPRRGIPRFFLDGEGSLLSVTDEEGVTAAQPRVWALLTHCLLESGLKDLSLPAEAPQSLESMAAHYGATLRFTGEPPLVLRDGTLAAVWLCRLLAVGHKTLSQLLGDTPPLSAVTTQVPLTQGRARAMERLSAQAGAHSGNRRGLLWRGDSGVVRVRPSADAEALRVCAEAHSMEAARELCEQFRRRIEDVDRP